MRTNTIRIALVFALLAASTSLAVAQSPDLYGDMQWRSIGPTRSSRTRALDGVADQPNAHMGGASGYSTT